MTTLTKAEIIDETIAYYSVDPEGRRAFDSVSRMCSYKMARGKMCAFGRCMTLSAVATFGDVGGPVGFLARALSNGEGVLDLLLRPEYHGHPVDFWGGVQRLHDSPVNWTLHGLSESGIEYARILRKKWAA